jgi:hypothetical protein
VRVYVKLCIIIDDDYSETIRLCIYIQNLEKRNRICIKFTFTGLMMLGMNSRRNSFVEFMLDLKEKVLFPKKCNLVGVKMICN